MLFHGHGAEPLPAIITKVWSDDCVNLRVFADDTGPLPWHSSVPLLDEHNRAYAWEWPPRV